MTNISAKRMMNSWIVYKILQIIEMIDKISKNEIEMIVWELTFFLNDEYKDVSTEMMMNHCMNFLIDDCRIFLMNEIDYCKDFLIFLKFLIIVMKWRQLSQKISRYWRFTRWMFIWWLMKWFYEWLLHFSINELRWTFSRWWSLNWSQMRFCWLHARFCWSWWFWMFWIWLKCLSKVIFWISFKIRFQEMNNDVKYECFWC
jgi:hypothetical protein